MTVRRSCPRQARGFTLIELMVGVAIIGLLSSVAVPSYQRMTLRTKAAERINIMGAIARAIGDTAITREPQAFPSDPMAGPWNPLGAPSGSKRIMDWSLGDWRRLPVIVEGATYYSYSFTASDNVGAGPPYIVVSALGDLDEDGVQSTKILSFSGVGYSFLQTNELPAPGDPANNLF